MNQWQVDLSKTQSEEIEHEVVRQSFTAEFSKLYRGELHVHMNGAIPVSTIQDILADELTELPSGFLIERDLLRHTPCQSLASYLTPWQVLRLGFYPVNTDTFE
ncbi:hypothetical protein [Pseudomonas aeruginosa]|uniref:hypothetical protein n=1 Tax=Pseudomonas aeruginosa TaxID=287 RepID=UPI0020B42078|nr:hypothetical protein [Pseudomonas aeruginosa]